MARHKDDDGDGIADAAQRPPLRYRRDVPRDDDDALVAEIDHVRAHLSSVRDLDDSPDLYYNEVTIQVVDHVDGDETLISVIGELEGEPDALYLSDDYDPAAEPPVEFVPYENPEADQLFDREAFAAFERGEA